MFWHLRHGGPRQVKRYRERERLRRATQSSTGQDASDEGRVTFPPWPLPDRPPRRPGLRVAVVLDDLSSLGFAYEWQQVPITPTNWRQSLTDEPVDLLFVESAWRGNVGSWKGYLAGTIGPHEEVRELADWCRDAGIPSVFWSKEDPAHYPDFLETARLFDYVFTTDDQRIDSYVEDLGHTRVGVLPFAAQPAIHNPVRPMQGYQARDIGFGGTYFAQKYPDRRAQIDWLLGAADSVSGRMPLGLEIFSSSQDGDEPCKFPSPLNDRVVNSLSYDRMLSAYRGYKVFLNVNTVNSPSVCARRIFEITACGTPVVSTPSPAIDHIFEPGMVWQVADDLEAQNTLRALVLSSQLRDAETHRAQRRIWSEHTYSHRVDAVLGKVGITGHAVNRPTVSVLVSTNRPEQLDHVLSTVAQQRGVSCELVLLTHGHHLSEAEFHAQASELGIESATLLQAPPSVLLGQCLNMLVAAAGGEVVTKMDDDDIYGVHYLSDQLFALEWSGADIVGKHAHYLHLGGMDAVVLRSPRREHKFTKFVTGPTIMTTRDLARRNPFPPVRSGEDSAFLRSATESGATIYASDRFGFLQVRRAPKPGTTSHTWNITELEILANSELQWFGNSTEHIMQ